MPREPPVRVVRELTSRGYNAEREAVTLLAGASDPAAAVERAVDAAPDDALTLTTDHVREVVDDATPNASDSEADASGGDAPTAPTETAAAATATQSADPGPEAPTDETASATASTGATDDDIQPTESTTPVETKGVSEGQNAAGRRDGRDARDDSQRSVEIDGDITGESTGTGEYADFVATFRDRYDRLSKKLRGRVNHRPTDALDSMPGGSEAAVVGMVNDVRSTASGHWLVEVEDTNGVFPTLVMKDRDIADHVDELLTDEVIAVEGTISDDGGILFADELHFPDIPRTHSASTADRHVQAALVSDVHVGSQEFAADAWQAFADWLHTEEADPVEYLLIAGDMVEGVGVYPDQDEELDIVDIYEQYETFAEHLKDVPGDMEIVMIPGNHDAVLTEVINRPKYTELDPTVVLFLTFPAFYGFMIGDLGYGILYGALGFWLYRGFDSEMISKLGGVAMWAGGFTALFGVLYGEIFGLHLVTEYLWHGALGLADAPLKKGLHVSAFAELWLAASLLFGIAHLAIGYVFGLVNETRSHGLKAAVTESGGPLLLMAGVGAWLFSTHMQSGGGPRPELLYRALELPPIVGIVGLALAVLGLVLVTIGEGAAGFLESPTYALVNTVSYTRIAAVLLAKAGMAYVVNLLVFGAYELHLEEPETVEYMFGLFSATLEHETHFMLFNTHTHGGEVLFPGLIHMGTAGVLGGIVVFVLGHLLVLALGVTSAGLQTLRLEYVEFFNKFYEGGGEKYHPFGHQRNYTTED
ncbi:DNA-directed DNA polymerase II small subunit [Halobacterium noricense]|uniref:DNA-directed DNA polymerase II small subunit n=1 Tax=Halobacterium noricense TaxID=223182 RepID=UPI001F3CFBB6|nr:DNA-directed DNA polymerase II small subunit [Halobacterium noricense]